MKHLISIQILTEYPLWFSVFCILLGVVYSFFLYRREEKLKDTKSWLLKLMAFCRFLLVSILAFLLLSPFVKTLFNKVEKPIIIIAHDNSSSILLNKDSTFYKSNYLKELSALKKDLEEKYEVKAYLFGEKLTEGLKIDYTDKVTNISNALDEVINKFYNRNVGALILASDGIFNQGSNPVFTQGLEFPIYTIALGDTTLQRDIVLNNVIYNKLTFLNNQFPIEIEASTSRCKGEKTKLIVEKNGKQLYEKQYYIDGDNFAISENILLDADKVGVQHYKIKLTSIDKEISYNNNVKDVYIEVLDGRQNILILSEAPHPDIKAIKSGIESNQNYKVTQHLINDFDGNTEPYSLVILNQINSINNGLDKFLKSNISRLYILGAGSSVQQFNQLNTGLSINNSRNKTSEILPDVNHNFPLFTLSETTSRYINKMPPAIGAFGNYKLNNEAYVLLNQRIGSVVTDNPLMLFFQNDQHKVGIIAGEGIWKWRLQDYLQNKTHDNFNEFINKTVQFLSVKEDKSKFRIVTKNQYFENEEIHFNAELYNESYELVNNPEIEMILTDESNNSFSFTFSKTSNAYLLNAGILPAGFYNYTAQVSYGTNNYKESGKFQIKPLLLEANKTVANHQLMQNIAEKYGAKMYYPNQINNLTKVITANDNITSVIYEENDLKELINLKWIFFILIILLSLEWFLRKRNGAY